MAARIKRDRSTKTINLELLYYRWGTSMCMGKVIVRCPNCRQQLQVTRPDSGHPFWSLEKPDESEGKVNVVQQVLKCKNSSCGAKFTVFWYDK